MSGIHPWASVRMPNPPASLPVLVNRFGHPLSARTVAQEKAEEKKKLATDNQIEKAKNKGGNHIETAIEGRLELVFLMHKTFVLKEEGFVGINFFVSTSAGVRKEGDPQKLNAISRLTFHHDQSEAFTLNAISFTYAKIAQDMMAELKNTFHLSLSFKNLMEVIKPTTEIESPDSVQLAVNTYVRNLTRLARFIQNTVEIAR